MSAIKVGSFFPCIVCGTPRWRRPSDVKFNKRLTCSKECLSKSFSGERNPFWGKKHSQETIDLIAATKRSRPTKKRTGPPKGYRHTQEAREKMSAALKLRWLTNRDKQLEAMRNSTRPARDEPRYRSNFTRLQRREWKEEKCAYCSTTESLVLDHVIPVMAGGKRERQNCQTLCQTCNIWKAHHVDKPIFLALLGSKSG